MTCKDIDIKELLPSYVSDELDDRRKSRVESHLASCEDCRQELGLLTMMSEETVPDPGEAFWAQMPGRIEREVRAGKAVRTFDLSRILDSLTLPRWSWTAAAVGALLLVTWFAIAPPDRQEGESPALQEVYDVGYGSLHDPVLTHPSTNMTDLSDPQLAMIDTWAGRELTAMAVEAESAALGMTDREEDDELTELNGQQIEELSRMLKDYYEEG
jgi:hypothetical protein